MSRLAKLRYMWQAALAYVFYFIARLLPIPVSSALGGMIGRIIGWRHKGTRHARKNLELILPERAAEHGRIVRGMWDNFGRVLGEYPHLMRMWQKSYIEVVGQENLPDNPSKIIFVAAHLANWETAPLAAAQSGWNMAAIYRPLNNVYLDPLLRRVRRSSGDKLFAKGAQGAMDLLRHVRRGGNAGVLVDQRLSDGINVPFFGHPSMTAPLPAVLAVKYGAQLLPARVERLGGPKLRLTLHKILNVPEAGTEEEKIEYLTRQINDLFESWIRARPEQWLWSHRRWRMKKDKKKASW